MDTELIERLARAAPGHFDADKAWLYAFSAALADECAKVAENYAAACEEESPYGASAAKDIADNIREKFSKETK